LYRTLFEALLTTSLKDTGRLSLLQQLYFDLGDIFAKPNFVSLLRYALEPLVLGDENQNSKAQSFDSNASSGPKSAKQGAVTTTGSLFLSPLISPLNAEQFRESLLQLFTCLPLLSELQKLAICFCFEIFDLDGLLDINQCAFTSNSLLSHFIFTQVHLLKDNEHAIALAKIIREDLRISFPLEGVNSPEALLNAPIADTTEMDNLANAFPTNPLSLNDDQIVNLFIKDGQLVIINDLFNSFKITPKLMVKFLFAICERPLDLNFATHISYPSLERLAKICREYLDSPLLLKDIIQAIDSEEFLNIVTKICDCRSFENPAFHCFWQFCILLCNSDKQSGSALIATLFFEKVWSYNLEFQVGFIYNCIKNQLVPKLLNNHSSESLSALVNSLENLKSQPDFESNPELNNWKYQKLYQILMELSIANHVGAQSTLGPLTYSKITKMFERPIQQCPDIVVLGLLGVTVNPCMCKNELLSQVIPAFLNNHPNAAIILHTIWNCTDSLSSQVQPSNSGQWAKQVLLQSMCEYYMKTAMPEDQPPRLSRILDVAQDLKALSLLLNSNCYPFVIDLACLASRREYLKLDKWLLDKIHNNGEPFINACIQFLNRRCPVLLNGARSLDGNQPQVSPNLPSETLATMLACLHQHVLSAAGQQSKLLQSQPLSQEISETILTMMANSSYLLQKIPRLAPPGVVNQPSKHSSTTTASNNLPTNLQPSLQSNLSSNLQQQQQHAQPMSNINDINLAALSISSNSNFNQPQRSSFASSIPQSQPMSQAGVQSNLSSNAHQVASSASPQSQTVTQPSSLAQVAQVQAGANVTAQQLVSAFDAQQLNDRLRMNPSEIITSSNQSISPDIEKEVNANFQRIYNVNAPDYMTVDQVLEMLKKYQESPNKREREIFTCMIKNLFDEYRYFPQYPDKELQITANLFGGIIQMGLVKYMVLVLALRYVLEALRKPYPSKMFYFGVISLDRFRTKLKEYPLYCHHLSALPQFNEFPSILVDYINYGKLNQYPPNHVPPTNVLGSNGSGNRLPSSSPNSLLQAGAASQSNSSASSTAAIVNQSFSNPILSDISAATVTNQASVSNRPAANSKLPVTNLSSIVASAAGATSGSSTRPSIANATNIDTLLAAGDIVYQTPSEAIQDKIAFIINNLSQMNIHQKTDEFRDVIGKEEVYNGWIAQYFVMKRASIEPNFHTLYANFIETLKLNELTKNVIRETYRNIKVLLGSDKEIANFGDRSLLKNLGHWLGLLTLARSRPILAIDLNLKYLLIEAYHKGMQELLYVVPFIAKVLESCAKSKVFRPPNPWTMSIVKVLIELHQEPNLKLNLKFEVEVLSKTLSVDINEWLGKSTALKSEQVLARVMTEQQLANMQPPASQPPTSSNAVSASSVNALPSASLGHQSNVLQSASHHSQMPISANLQTTQLTTQTSVSGPSSAQIQPVLQALASGATSQDSQLLASNVHSGSPTVNAFNRAMAGNIVAAVVASFANGQTPTTAQSQLASSGVVTTSSGEENAPRLFNYADIHVNSVVAMYSQVYLQQGLPLLQLLPTLRQLVRPAVEKAIQEVMHHTIDRTIKITVITAEQIIKKDFALENDEQRMCVAAQCLVRSLTSGMAMIQSKEQLFVALKNSLVSAFTTATGVAANKELIEATAQTIAANNIDLACAYLQKAAVEKAIAELDKRLASDYELRQKARQEGRRYIDLNAASIQERMPEQIKIKAGLSSQRFAIYEELANNIPGFASTAPVVSSQQTSQQQQQQQQLVNQNAAALGLAGQVALDRAAVANAQQLPIALQSPAALGNAGHYRLPLITSQMPGHNGGEQNQVDTVFLALFEKSVPEIETLLQQFVQVMQPSNLTNSMHAIYELIVQVRTNPQDMVLVISLIQKLLEAVGELISSVDSSSELLLLTRARDLYIMILKGLAETGMYGLSWVSKQITRLVLERLLNSNPGPAPLPDDQFDILMRAGLINVPLLDYQLVSLFETSTHPLALAFTLQFAKLYGGCVREMEIQNILCALVKLSKDCISPLALEIRQLLESFRPATVRTFLEYNDRVSRPFITTLAQLGQFSLENDLPEFMDKTEKLLREWINIYNSTTNLNKVFNMYVQSMNQQGILKTDDSITRFFRVSTELCVGHCYRFLSTQQPNNQSLVEVRGKCFYTLDAFAHLIVMLIKHSGSNTGAALESSAKLNLLSKVLVIIASVAIQDQNNRNNNFQHLPYYRIFVILFIELTLGPNNLTHCSLQNQLGYNTSTIDPFHETIHYQVLHAFCQALRLMKPSKAPSFAFAWLDFISHRTFIDKCLNGPGGSTSASGVASPDQANNAGQGSVGNASVIGNAASGATAIGASVGANSLHGSAAAGANTKGWPSYAQLLIELIKFEAPFLRNVELPQSVDLLYKGTLKLLLVLLRDFPEFLCEYCHELCNVIPYNAVQMRNLVCCAFPRHMRLPDPFKPNFKIDLLPEIMLPHKTLPNNYNLILMSLFKPDLDNYLMNREPNQFFSLLRNVLLTGNNKQMLKGGMQQQTSTDDSCKYDISFLNALVLYVGQKAIMSIQPKKISMSTIAPSAHMDIFQDLATNLDNEGRYMFLNAIANQLRYPNSNTHYFSCTLLYLFAEATTESVQEQITRVLLERLIVSRPHPWGLLVTFLELIKDPVYKFWQHEFVRCAPEIEK
jgi:hypothetical protein